jgi:CheY-like chemotaxis protein
MTKILIIDDDPAMRKLVTVVLRSLTYEVFEASNGPDGVALAKSHMPDAIICDYHMPSVNGLGTIKIIRAEQSLKNTPVIVATTGISRQGFRAFQNLGVRYCFIKPIDFSELKKKVQEVLGKAVNTEQCALNAK